MSSVLEGIPALLPTNVGPAFSSAYGQARQQGLQQQQVNQQGQQINFQQAQQVDAIVSKAAQLADTPQKWAQTMSVLQKNFPQADLTPFQDFSARDTVLAQLKDPYKDASLSLDQQRLALDKANADRTFQLQVNGGGIPAGYRRTADGGMEPVPGGPAATAQSNADRSYQLQTLTAGLPPGYRRLPDGSMEAIPGGPAALEAQKTAQDEAYRYGLPPPTGTPGAPPPSAPAQPAPVAPMAPAPDPATQGTLGTPDAQTALLAAAASKRQSMGLAAPPEPAATTPNASGPAPAFDDYTMTPIPEAGGLTQAAIDQRALDNIVNDKQVTTGRTGLAGMQNRAIANRQAVLQSSGSSLAGNKATLKALSSALTQNTEYVNNTERAFNTANDTLTALTSWMKDNGINPSQFPDYNSFVNFLKGKGVDPGAAGGYNAQIATLRSEYAQVLARGGTVTDQSRNQAAALIPNSLSPAQLQTVADRLNVDANNVVSDAQKQIKQIHDQIYGIAQPPAGQGPQAAPAASAPAPASGGVIDFRDYFGNK